MILIIEHEPKLQLYADRTDMHDLDSHHIAIRCLKNPGSSFASAETGTENANISISCHRHPDLEQYISYDPPVNRRALLMQGKRILFDGSVQSLRLADDITFTLET